jgi:hypothetical protein
LVRIQILSAHNGLTLLQIDCQISFTVYSFLRHGRSKRGRMCPKKGRDMNRFRIGIGNE